MSNTETLFTTNDSNHLDGIKLIHPELHAIYESKDSISRIFIVGDVHGCIDELNELINTALPDYNPKHDRILFVGDLVAKGPDSSAVINRVIELGGLSVIGNHDQQVLKCAKEQGRLEILQNNKVNELKQHHSTHLHPKHNELIDYNYYGSLADCGSKCVPEMPHWKLAQQFTDTQLQFLASLPLTISLPEYNIILVHAGLLPNTPIAKQTDFNCMNLRDILPDGTGSQVHNGSAWAKGWHGPPTVIFGHDASRNLQREEWAIGLDTGCCYGGKLSGYLLPEKKIISVDAKQVYSKPKTTD